MNIRRVGSFWRRSHSHHNNDQFLTLFTIFIFATDEVKRTRSIKLELRLTILQLLHRILLVALVIVLLVHHQHRI